MSVVQLRDAIKARLDDELGTLLGAPDADRLRIANAFAEAIDPHFVHTASGVTVSRATAEEEGVVKTDVTSPDPVVYLKDSVDTLLSLKANVSHTHSAADINVGTLDAARLPSTVALRDADAYWTGRQRYLAGGNPATPLVHYPSVFGYSINATVTGAWVLHTPIGRASSEMFKIRVHGYLYNHAKSLDFTVVGYAYSGSNGQDGQPGRPLNYSIVDHGNDGWSKYLGVGADGNIAIAFGDIDTSAYIGRIWVDLWSSLYAIDYTEGWSLEHNTTDGFGWLDIRPLTASISAHEHDAADITSGILDDARLSPNIPRKNEVNDFTRLLTVRRPAEADHAFDTYIDGDVDPRFAVRVGGELEWGDGSVRDTSLYRQGAGHLRTGGRFSAVTALSAPRVEMENPSFYWTLSQDTYHEFRTPYGYIHLGPGSAAGAHIRTDRDVFFFNKPILVSGVPLALEDHTHDAADIASGTLDDARLSSNVLRGNQRSILSSQLVSGNTDWRVGYNVVQGYSQSSTTAGALVIKTGMRTGEGSTMFVIRVSGRLHSQSTPMDMTLSGYSYSTGTISQRGYLSQSVDFLPQVRMARDPNGYLCIILGDVDSTWSYPRLFVPYAAVGYSGTPETVWDGWEVQFVTDLTGWTNIVDVEDKSHARYFDGQPSSFYRNADNLNAGTVAIERMHASVARRDVANTFAEPMTISGGAGTRLVVGNPTTTAPTITLGRISGQPNIKGSEGYLIMDSGGQSAALNYFVSDNVLLAYGGGRVGVGTASPQSRLHVAGDVRWDGTLVAGEVPFARITGLPTTLAGHGITDAYTKTEADAAFAAASHDHDRILSVSSYSWSAATAPRGFGPQISHSFVSSEEGWPMPYGKVLHVGSINASQDGGALQILVPYGPAHGGTKLMYRLGQYNNLGWTAWDTIASEAWADAKFSVQGHTHTPQEVGAQPESTYLSRIGSPSSYGSIGVSGLTNNYAGVQFTGTDQNWTFMVQNSATGRSGLYNRTAGAWSWLWENGTLLTGTVPWDNVGSKPVYATRWPTPSEIGAAAETHNHDGSYLKLGGGLLTGNLTISKSRPWITLDSPSTGDNALEQGAGISIGESGFLGGANLHLTYTGDGYGYIGMGSVDDTGIPSQVAMRLYYQSQVVNFYARPQVGSKGVVLADDSPTFGTVTASGYDIGPNTWRGDGGWNKFTTPSGYIWLGPANTSYAHIYTDRPLFYLNAPLRINSGAMFLGEPGIELTSTYLDIRASSATYNNGIILRRSRNITSYWTNLGMDSDTSFFIGVQSSSGVGLRVLSSGTITVHRDVVSNYMGTPVRVGAWPLNSAYGGIRFDNNDWPMIMGNNTNTYVQAPAANGVITLRAQYTNIADGNSSRFKTFVPAVNVRNHEYAAIIISTQDPSGEAEYGTLWVKVNP